MRRNDTGFSLIELAITTALLVALAGAVYGLMHGASNAYLRDSARQTLQDNARRLLDEISSELRDADQNNFLITGSPSATVLRFRKAKSFDTSSTTMTWTDYIEYRYEASPVDANNNGIADEGRVVRQGPDAAGSPTRTVLCDYVLQSGFTAVKSGNKITLSVALFAMSEPGKRVDMSLSSSVSLRNQP